MVEQPVGVQCGWCPMPLLAALMNLNPNLGLGGYLRSFNECPSGSERETVRGRRDQGMKEQEKVCKEVKSELSTSGPPTQKVLKRMYATGPPTLCSCSALPYPPSARIDSPPPTLGHPETQVYRFRSMCT